MLISCRDVIQLPSLKKLKIVAGGAGLDRTVRWVHVLDMPDVVNWVRGGELLFMTGISLKSPMDLLGIVQDLASNNLAGLVITPGKYISSFPDEVIDLANQLNFPLFELPWEVKLVEVFKEVTSFINHKQADQQSMQDILKKLLFGENENVNFLVQRAAYYGHNLNELNQVLVVRINNLEEYISQTGRKTENAIFETTERFEQIVLDVVVRNYVKPVYLVWLDSLIIVLPVKKQGKKAVENNMKTAAQTLKELTKGMPGLVVNVGIGNLCSGPGEIRKSFHQAEQALKFGLTSGKSNLYSYEQMGLGKLLFAVPDEVLHFFYQDYILPLKEYDSDHGLSLISDLEVFLQHNGNYSDAAKSLFIHRNTLIYRMNKIQEITGKSLDDFQNRIGFYIGIVIGKHFL